MARWSATLTVRPTFNSIPLSEGLRWRPGSGWRYEEKLDGRWHVEDLPRATVVGELMRNGAFFASTYSR